MKYWKELGAVLIFVGLIALVAGVCGDVHIPITK